MLRLDETSIGKVYLKDRPLIKRHISIVSTLEWNQVTCLDDVRLSEVFELDVLIL